MAPSCWSPPSGPDLRSVMSNRPCSLPRRSISVPGDHLAGRSGTDQVVLQQLLPVPVHPFGQVALHVVVRDERHSFLCVHNFCLISNCITPQRYETLRRISLPYCEILRCSASEANRKSHDDATLPQRWFPRTGPFFGYPSADPFRQTAATPDQSRQKRFLQIKWGFRRVSLL